MKIEQYIELFDDSTWNLNGREMKRVPIGTFAGAQELLLVVRNDKSQAFNTGDQGGGQN